METPLLPCLTANEIIKEKTLQPYFQALKQLISAPGDIYEELYQTTLNRFSEFCQAMPFSIIKPEPYGLLIQQLKLTIATLKLFRGYMLPINSDSESIAEQEPLWSYAILTASLLTQIDHIQTDRTVMLYQSHSHQLGQWHPLTGCLYEPKTYYQILPTAQQITVNPYLLRITLLGKLIPNVALRWLTGVPPVFTVWWETVVGKMSKNIFTQIIQKAAEKTDYPLDIHSQGSTLIIDTITAVTPPSNPSPKENKSTPLQTLMDWLLQSSEKQPNQPAFRVNGGYLLSLTLIESFLSTQTEKNDLSNFIEQIDTQVLKNQDTPLHHYRRITNRQRIQGIVIAEEHLPDSLKQEAISTNFVIDTAI